MKTFCIVCLFFCHFLHFILANNVKLCYSTSECLLVSGTRLMKPFSPASIRNAALLCCVSCLQQIDYLISQYATAKNKVIYDLDSK